MLVTLHAVTGVVRDDVCRVAHLRLAFVVERRVGSAHEVKGEIEVIKRGER
jgi:hypothetical protein